MGVQLEVSRTPDRDRRPRDLSGVCRRRHGPPAAEGRARVSISIDRARGYLYAASIGRPDVLMHLELEAHRQTVFENPLRDAHRFETAERAAQKDRIDA